MGMVLENSKNSMLFSRRNFEKKVVYVFHTAGWLKIQGITVGEGWVIINTFWAICKSGRKKTTLRLINTLEL